MKKFFTLCAAAALAVSASAQTVTESKTFDNWYIGVNGGLGGNWRSAADHLAFVIVENGFAEKSGLAVYFFV